jgi:hypothetical protein
MPWTILLHAEFEPEFGAMAEEVQDALLEAARVLEAIEPTLGRPTVDTLNYHGSLRAPPTSNGAKSMATTLSQIMAGLPAERRKKVETRAAARIAEEMALRDLRKAMGKTQVEVARKLRISQVSLSDTERRTDVMLSTLRKYVGALGGELDLVARFPNRAPIKIANLSDIAPPVRASGQRKPKNAAGRGSRRRHPDRNAA